MATGAVIAGIVGVSATTAAVIAAGINMAISFAASYLLAKQSTSGGSMSASDYKQTIQQDKVAQRVMYGRRQVSIVMNFAEEQDGVQGISNKDGESHELLYLSGMFCNHPVNSYSDVYLDDKPLSDYDGNATVHHINGTGIIPQDWMDETTQYESTMTGSSGYWAAIKLRHDSTVFSGIPTLKVTVEGKLVKDFRTGQMVYTNNAALVIADFYINYMSIPESRLLMSGTGSFIDAANICDEIMPDGNRRYEINGMFELDAKPSDILNEMLKSCGGTLIRMNGVIGLLPAAYYGEVVPFVVSESDIVGGISMSPQESLSDCVNIMSGTYVEEEDDWSEQDFPPIPDEAAIARDGFEIPDDIDYAFVTNALQAQRLINIELRRRTAGGFTELTMSPKGAYCRVGRVVEINLPQLSLSGEFRITSQVENSDLTFTITMQRDDIEIYDDAIGEPYSPPPLLDLGGGTLASPSGLQFVYSYNDAVGNVIQGVLTWQNNSASTSYFNVVITDDDGNIVQAGDTKGYVFNVNALPIGNYIGKVRAVDTRGRTSSYATVSFSVGEPSVPASFRDIASPDDGQVHTLYARSNWNIAITPNIIGGTPQGTEFEFWHLADSGSYITGQPEYDEGSINLATLVATASSLNNGGLIPDRWQHYWVRSVNPYGKSDFIYLQTGTAKEQDLVTTVVERLKAIEVESQNWLADPDTNWSEYGYKLFSAATGAVTMPDGTVLDNPDGLAVFQNIIANGHITAKSLTFVDDDAANDAKNSMGLYPDQDSVQIQGNYQSGQSGWAIDKYGNCELNNGVFRGIIQTSQIYSTDFFLQCVPLAYYYSYPDTPLGTGNSVDFQESGSNTSFDTGWKEWVMPLRAHNDRNSPVVTATRARYSTPRAKGSVGYVYYYMSAGNQYYQGHFKARIVAYNANGTVYQDSGEYTVNYDGVRNLVIGGVTWDIVGDMNASGTHAAYIRLPSQRGYSTDKTFRLFLRGTTTSNASFWFLNKAISVDNTTD